MTKGKKILSYIAKRNEPVTTVEIYEDLFNGNKNAIEERALRRKEIISISNQMNQLCIDGSLIGFSAQKRGLFYALPEWYSGSQLKPRYQYKLENKISPRISIAIIDDQVLLRKGLVELIHSFGDTDVIIEAENVEAFFDQINDNVDIPDICIIGSQAIMNNNNEALKTIKNKYSTIKVVMLTTYNEEYTYTKMMLDGANAVLTKSCQPKELQQAINFLRKHKYYFESVTKEIWENLGDAHIAEITEKQQVYMSLAVEGLSAAEMATRMGLSERTIDGYRELLYKNFNVDNRQIFLVFIIKNGLIDLNNTTTINTAITS